MGIDYKPSQLLAWKLVVAKWEHVDAEREVPHC